MFYFGFEFFYDEKYGGEVGKIEKWSIEYILDRGRVGDMMVVLGGRKSWSWYVVICR